MGYDEVEKQISALGYEVDTTRVQSQCHDPKRDDYKEGYFEAYYVCYFRKKVVDEYQETLVNGEHYNTKLEALEGALRSIKKLY